ncbi:DUF4124 domain-containing protein [Alteromonas sp. 14N.309.X.WAT.G.H12]|uniref:DUF4124 domain-containing protein n=1 Tax=Alteromonas sp. 14N.309.X.WAT.G.H12 TaxID=3120824 RepID=UPI002FD79A68
MKKRLLLLWFVSSLLSAQTIYKIVKPDGTVLYTDTPQEGAEPVVLDSNTQNVAAPTPTQKPLQSQQTKKQKVIYEVSITSPEPEATVRNNLGTVIIKATASPTYKGRYQLTFDDQTNWTNSSGIFKLSDIDRGAHSYRVDLIDNKGKTLASSPQQTLYLHHASVLINAN